MDIMLGFSSMGQPELSFSEFEALAREFDMDFIELRSLEGSLDLPGCFKRRGKALPSVPVRLLASSLQLAKVTPADLEEFFRFGDLAENLQTPYVRVFGGGSFGDPVTDAMLHAAASTVETLRERIRREGWKFEILLETHSAFSSSRHCSALNRLLKEPLGILWDSHHTWKLAGEDFALSWNLLGPWVRHVHFKDSRTADGTCHLVLPGEGNFPAAELLELLTREGFRGGLALEWEKLWHPELPPLHDALGAFARVIRQGS